LSLVWILFDGETSFATALGFGVATVVVPWFFMQPAFGLDVMAVKAAKPAVIRAHSLSSHAAFGAGLYLAIPIA
jgi:hypothetical protein